LFRGIGDQSESWRGVQERLAKSGVRSLIFHYPGYGGNDADATVENMEADARTAYTWLVDQAPASTPAFLFGFSLGSGLSTAVAPSLRPVPAGLILSEAFSSLREGAKRAAWPLSPLGHLIPDVWRTRGNVGTLEMPLFVIHSSGDRLFPTAMAYELYAAAKEGGVDVAMEVLAGYPHDAVFRQVPEDYWTAILGFITRVSNGLGG
jgi:acetyl esterase/lipase